jgi:putative transposase
MSQPEYIWRKLTPEQREEMLAWRKARRQPWHSPPRLPNFGHLHFHITAACYEHRPYIGHSLQRMDAFAHNLLAVFTAHANQTFAWCVLPNHYHALVETPDLLVLSRELGRLHGRTSHAWNGEECARGRKVFFRVADRVMRSERHFWATMNYIHHNPVHHGYVERWLDWPWSSASDFLAQLGRHEAEQIWLEYAIEDYGKGWDDPEM